MASKDKPYRVYRGGRSRGPVRPLRPKERPARVSDGRPPQGDGYLGSHEEPVRKRRRWWRWVVGVILLVILFFVVWAVLGYLAFKGGVEDANARLPKSAERALTPQDGAIWTNPTNVLVLGADVGIGKGRTGNGRSDSMLLIHTDPDHHRLAQLSIPRDLRVTIPGHGEDKINAAYSYGGPALAIRTVKNLTGIPVNHVILVNFRSFDDVVDALGGVTVDVKKPILSKFDCPYGTPARCERWPGWRFEKGEQTLHGQRALVYSRVRENKLDPADSDFSRAQHQQEVVQAIADKVVSFKGFMRMPFIGGDLVKPLATDLTANELLQLGWVKFRAPASQTISCSLGGTIGNVDGASVILGSEDNPEVIQMVLGQSAPQPPAPGNPFNPGCRVGGAR
ncbi:MAG TPA: LCP family protein [Gaiellaceae bacterium]